MMKIAILLALAVAVSAGGYGGGYSGGCFLEEEMTCVKKNAVMCGSDWCFGHCSVDIAKKCDTKVWFKTVCDEVDFCKEIRTPCGHDGDDEAGLFCSFNEDCLVDKKCKLVPADKKSSYGGHWHAKSMPGGFFEMCKDTYSCGVFDPWALDASEVEVTCTKEYEIVEDMSCESLFAYESWFGKGGITESKFMMMNSGFKCGKHLVGKVVCVEADIAVKAVECGGSLCEEGFECATKETCEDVAVEKPVCLKEPVYSCLKEGSFESTICGNQICGPSEKCEIIANKVCPSETIVVPGPQIIPGAPQVIPGAPQVIPGAPQVIPGAPQVIPAAPQVIPAAPQVIPGTPTVIPGTPTVVPAAPVTPVTPATPAAPATPPAEPAPPVPLASVVSQSLSDALGTVTYTDAVANGGNAYTGGYSTGDYGFSRSDSGAFDDGTAVAYTDVDATLGYEAQADSFATSNPGPPSPPATP